MQAVQEENRKKSEELESIRSCMLQNHTKPVPPPFPAELDRYSRRAEQTPENGVQTISSPIIHPRLPSPPLSPHSSESPLRSPRSHPLYSMAPSSPSPPSPIYSKPSSNHPSIEINQSPSPTFTVHSPTKARSVPSLPPPKPASLLQEIRDPSNHVKLRKVPK